jgi:hypothetical protein
MTRVKRIKIIRYVGRWAATVVCSGSLGSCTIDHQFVFANGAPNSLQSNPSFDTLLSDYQAGSRLARNQIIRRLMLIDDEYFQRYCSRLYGGRAVADTASDIVNTGLTTAATAVNPAAAAKILTGIAAGLIASKISIDKNIFLQQATPALIAKMEAQRAQVDAHIQQFLMETVADYPLEEGMRDFIKYYKAGTIAAAAQSLTANAEDERSRANETLQLTKTRRTPLEKIFAAQHGITFTRAPAPPIVEGTPVLPPPPDLKPFVNRIKLVESIEEPLAKTILDAKSIPIPPGQLATETLAEEILKSAELKHVTPLAGPPALSASESIAYYRFRASDDPKRTKKLAGACDRFVATVPSPPLPQ